MRVARVMAQAKINLSLQVHHLLDEGGYHRVATVLQRIDLADDVVVRLGGTVRSLDVSGPRLPAGGLGPVENNLAYRAAAAYVEHHGRNVPKGFAIEITKHIPVGGGLGGGSADAGAVLRALEALSGRTTRHADYMDLARRLGSDVPFLASELPLAPAFGRGDKIVTPAGPITPGPEWDVLLVVPSFGIATADAYRWLDEDRPTSPWRFDDFGGLAPLEGLSAAVNDFEPVVERRYPMLRQYRERLRDKGAALAMLAGSGSTVFGIFDDGAPRPGALDFDADVIATRTSARVVQVEVLE